MAGPTIVKFSCDESCAPGFNSCTFVVATAERSEAGTVATSVAGAVPDAGGTYFVGSEVVTWLLLTH
ncbi:MAG TPA: hypothetical protein VGI34_03885 [Candidatus Acidoferrales bacterium]|jgi:hypothetical protein